MLSRIDGTQTLRDVLLATGLPVERGVAIVRRLRSIGALLLPGESAAPAAAAAAARGAPGGHALRRGPAAGRTRADRLGGSGADHAAVDASDARPPRAQAARRAPAPADLAAEPRASRARRLAAAADRRRAARAVEAVELDDAERRRILAMARLVATPRPVRDPRRAATAPTPSALKRAYFKLSKDVHPDRYYGKQLGSFAIGSRRCSRPSAARTRA